VDLADEKRRGIEVANSEGLNGSDEIWLSSRLESRLVDRFQLAKAPLESAQLGNQVSCALGRCQLSTVAYKRISSFDSNKGYPIHYDRRSMVDPTLQMLNIHTRSSNMLILSHPPYPRVLSIIRKLIFFLLLVFFFPSILRILPTLLISTLRLLARARPLRTLRPRQRLAEIQPWCHF
jgi:hypothetical protein